MWSSRVEFQFSDGSGTQVKPWDVEILQRTQEHFGNIGHCLPLKSN